MKSPSGSFKSLILRVEPPRHARRINRLLINEYSADAPFLALAYTNLIVFIAALASFAGLSPYGAISYVFTSIFFVAIITLLSTRLTPILPGKFHKQFIFLSTLGYELALISLLYFNYVTVDSADNFVIIPVIIGMSFITISLCARFVFPFFIIKIIIFLICSVFIYFSPDIGIEPLPFFSISIVCVMIILTIGYWVIKRKREAIRLRSELVSLNQLADERNLKLDQALADAKVAQENAAESFTLRQNLLSYIGHDLRQPVNAADFILRELSEKYSQADEAILIQNLNACVKSMKRMIEDLLQLTHYNNENIKVIKDTLDLSVILKQIVQEYTEPACDVGIRIRYVPTSLRIISDGLLVTRIIRNLIQNAIKHAQASAIVLGVRHKRDFIEIWVVDNGQGLKGSTAKSLLKTSTDPSNMGLGLIISRQLATACGAELRLVSNPEHGTCARLRIEK